MELFSRILELSRQGFFCSQIMSLLKLLEKKGNNCRQENMGNWLLRQLEWKRCRLYVTVRGI